VNKFRVFVLLLLLLTAIFVGYVTHVRSQSEEFVGGLFYEATLLEDPPSAYWNLTNPDIWILEAINNPGKSVRVDQEATTFLADYPGPSNIRYNDKYYHVTALFVDEEVGDSYLIGPAFAGLLTAWVSVGAVVIVKRKTLR